MKFISEICETKNKSIKTKTKKMSYKKQIVKYAIEQLNNIDQDVYGCDLHNELFNKDYFVVGYHDSINFLVKYGGAFKAIARIKSYELEMFGEVNTDFSDCEKVANMLAYIEGELLLMESSEHLALVWDSILSEDDIAIIKKQLKNS